MVGFIAAHSFLETRGLGIGGDGANALEQENECNGGVGGCALNALQLSGRAVSQKEPVQEPIERRFFMWFSDVHMDPYYGVPHQWGNEAAVCVFGCHGKKDCSPKVTSNLTKANPLGIVGCDPPNKLVESVVAASAEQGIGAEFAVFTGDFVRHGQHRMPDPARNVSEVINEVSRTLATGFQWLDEGHFVVGTIGNDDSPQNYELNITEGIPNPWLNNVGAGLAASGVMPRDRWYGFADGGFFEALMGNVRILTINTIIYSVRHVPKNPAPDDPFGQFAWLRTRLEESVRDGKRVWIVGHIPPGMETFGFTALWKSKYVTKYLDLVQDSRLGSIVAAQLFGHVHADEFRILPNAPAGAGPVLLTGAVSPIYRSNPSFRLVEYDGLTGGLLNVKVFYALMPQKTTKLEWQFGYDLLGTYPSLKAGGPILTNDDFKSLASHLKSSWSDRGFQWRHYAEWYKTKFPNDLECASLPSEPDGISNATRKRFISKYFCALEIGTAASFKKQTESFSLSAQAPPRWESYETGALFYHDARVHHWRTISTEDELARVELICGHMVRQIKGQVVES